MVGRREAFLGRLAGTKKSPLSTRTALRRISPRATRNRRCPRIESSGQIDRGPAKHASPSWAHGIVEVYGESTVSLLSVLRTYIHIDIHTYIHMYRFRRGAGLRKEETSDGIIGRAPAIRRRECCPALPCQDASHCELRCSQSINLWD